MPFITLGNSLCYAMWPDLDRLTKGKIEEEAGKYTGEKPEFWMIQVCPWGTATLDRLNVIAEELRAAYPDTVEFVRADHLFMLRAEYDGEPFNVALRASAAASGYDGDATPDKAVDGSFAADKGWACSAEEKWLALDLGRTYRLSRYVIKHASTGYFPAEENARAWTFQVSDDGKSWQDADTVSGSADAISYRKLTKRVSARYIRLRITDPGASGTARIQELEVYGAVEK